jgi:glycosyl transferase family 25
MISYKIYYINLDRSKDRREFMEKQFSSLGVSLQRIDAVNGKNLSQEAINKARKEQDTFAHFGKMHYGEIGCFDSFVKSFNMIANQKEDFAILFEDDALIDGSFFTDLPNILNFITNEDIVDITGRKGFWEIENKNLINKFIIPPVRNTAQIIGKNAGKKFSTFFNNSNNKYYAPIDVVIQDIYSHKINIYTTKKSYVSHNDYNISGTTAQNKKISKGRKILRELIRPLWQLASLFVYKIKRFILNYKYYSTNI